jgi:hypothetical protein
MPLPDPGLNLPILDTIRNPLASALSSEQGEIRIPHFTFFMTLSGSSHPERSFVFV